MNRERNVLDIEWNGKVSGKMFKGYDWDGRIKVSCSV